MLLDLLTVAGITAVLIAAPLILATPAPDPVEADVEDETEDVEDECPTCHGCGVVDIADDYDRPIIADADCLLCAGTGRIEAA